MENLFRVTRAQTRSISPETRTGEPGQGGRTPLEEGSAGIGSGNVGL